MASRGKGRRRREAMELRASAGLLKRGKVGNKSSLPPPPNVKDGEQHVPSSLRTIMALRSGAPAPGTGRRHKQDRSRKARFDSVTPSESISAAERSTHQKRSRSGAAAVHPERHEKIAANDVGRSADQRDRQEQQISPAETAAGARQPQASSVPGTVITPPPLTDRQLARRERIKVKRRKQKGRGRAALNATEPSSDAAVAADVSSDEDAVARRVLVDPNKPAFGEQANAPLQTVLKRRHWDKGANSRHQVLFEHQMQQACKRLAPQQAKDEALRSNVIGAYRQARRKGSDGHGRFVSSHPATLQSLKALVAGRDMRQPAAFADT